MKCKNCGAPLVGSKCEYCEYEHNNPDNIDISISINTYDNHVYNDKPYVNDVEDSKNNTYNNRKYTDYAKDVFENAYHNHQYSRYAEDEENKKKKKKNIGLQIFLWLFFWYIMIFVVIIKSKRLSPAIKAILCPVVGLLLLIPMVSDCDTPTEVEPQYFEIGTKVQSGDFEILVTGCSVENDGDIDMLLIDFEMKYIGDDKVYPSHMDYKLHDDDGLVFEDNIFHLMSSEMPTVLEPGEKGIGQMAFELTHEVKSDLIFYIGPSKYSYRAKCDVNFIIPKEKVVDISLH